MWSECTVYHWNSGWTVKNQKLEISLAVVCTSVKILKIRRMVNKMGGGGGGHLKLKWVYLPHSKLEGGGHHILLFCYLLNRDYHNTPN